MIEKPYRLSPMQQGMVFHSLYAQHSGIEIEQMIYTLHEDLHITLFQSAWQYVIQRHPILRTSFQWEGVDEPVQQVHTLGNPLWIIEDWRGTSPEKQKEKLAAYLRKDRSQGFKLTETSLNRFALFRLGESDYQFVWTFHHAIIDGRSFVIVLKEAFAFYEASLVGEELALPQPRPYRDYINWLSEQDLTQAESFWRTMLKGFASPTPLVVNRNFAAINREPYEYTEQQEYLSASLTSALKALAKNHGITLNTIVQGAWALLLSLYSGEGDVVFGATRACRRTALEGADHMVGPFINTLPMRIQVNGDTELIEWLKEIRNQHLALREHEHTPLLKIQKWCEVPRGRSLFDTILVFENYELDSYLHSQGGNWENREFELLEQTNYPLALSGWAGAELLLKLAYHQRNFADDTIIRMLGHLKTLLEGFAANPQKRLSEYTMLTKDEQQGLLINWNDTSKEYASHLCIHQLFESQVEKTPDAIAVRFEDEQLTYRELNAQANQLACYLRGLGVQTDELVGIAMERSVKMIVGLFGILKAGASYLPLDPSYPKERIAAILQDAQPQILLTEQQMLGKLPEYVGKIICIDSDWRLIREKSQENPSQQSASENLAYTIYTSGSTGKPKGVMIEHHSLVNFTEWAKGEYAIRPGDRILQFASFSFDASAEEIYPCLTSGATLILRNETMLTSISTFLETCRNWAVTILDLPTAFWHEMVEMLGADKLALPPSLRLIIIGGERVLPERLAKWHKAVGERVRLVNTYGPTETTIVATMADVTAIAESEGFPDAPIGRAIQNVQTYILNRFLHPMPVGVPGELYIGGLGLARGYINQPELTSKSFITNPFFMDEKERLYKSGDLVRFLPDGQIEFFGRVDNQVKINGYRIEPGEIESVIAQSTITRDVVVLARETAQGNNQLVTYVVPVPEYTAREHATIIEELRSFLKSKLPAYMVPSAFVILDELPINANGKVNHKALSTADHPEIKESHNYAKPTDPLQYQLVQIWEELFDYRPIGITDNFFDLGGHSLLSVRLMDRIEQTFGKKLELATLFSGATIKYLAKALLELQTEERRLPLVAIQTGGSKQPFYYLHGDFNGGGLYCLKLARYLGDEQPFYVIQPHGIDGRQIPKTIEQMAEDHIRTLRAFQPEGPYQLGGHCNGGLLAFEMARQLERVGQRVNLLVLIGATGMNARYRFLQSLSNRFCAIRRKDADARQELFLQLRERVLQLSDHFHSYGELIREVRPMQAQANRPFLFHNSKKWLKSFYNLFTRSESDNPSQNTKRKSAQSVGERQAINQDYARAMMSYVPRQYAGRVTLFWPSEWLEETANDPTVGWRKIAAEVDVHIVPGGHLTCLIDNMDELALHLRRCLDNA